MHPGDIEYIIVHCSATKPSQDIGVRDIDRWHRENGWSGCGYHWVIKRDGTIQAGRNEGRAGAHCKGVNTISIGVCLVGGIAESSATAWGQPENNFTRPQFHSLSRLLHELLARYPKARVKPHSAFANKSCPCFPVEAWWNSVRDSSRVPPPPPPQATEDGHCPYCGALL